MFFVPPDLNATISELSAMRLFRETPCAAAPSLPPPHAKITGIILWFFNGIYSIGLPLSQDIYEGSAIERQGHCSAQIWIVKRRLVAVWLVLLDGKAVEMALAGDGTALRLCLDRIIPPRRERPVRFKMPVLQSPADAVAAMRQSPLR